MLLTITVFLLLLVSHNGFSYEEFVTPDRPPIKRAIILKDNGERVTIEYDIDGEVVSISKDRLVSRIIGPPLEETEYVYDGNILIDIIKREQGIVIADSYEIDNNGNIIKEPISENEFNLRNYDDSSNLLWECQWSSSPLLKECLVNEYDDNGNLIKSYSTDVYSTEDILTFVPSSFFIYDYDIKGRLVKISEYHLRELKKATHFIYNDEENQKITIVSLDNGEEYISISTRYDMYGREVVEGHYNPSGSNKIIKYTEYNDYGEFKNIYYSDGSGTEWISDKYGNWIIKIESTEISGSQHKIVSLTSRKIEYYEPTTITDYSLF